MRTLTLKAPGDHHRTHRHRPGDRHGRDRLALSHRQSAWLVGGRARPPGPTTDPARTDEISNELQVPMPDGSQRDDADLRGDVLAALMLDSLIPMTVDAKV